MKNSLALKRVQKNYKLYKDKLANRLVYIWSCQWGCYWRAERSGYTKSQSEAGVYLFADALDASAHCGAEKGIYYILIPKQTSQETTQTPKGPAMLMLKEVI